ncbi:MAG: substrate-binding domain-containing protein, partial [Microthrixaceae bacterium]|nr:substrate-binding domain-containing protein [Microthrixaceae bacterium]
MNQHHGSRLRRVALTIGAFVATAAVIGACAKTKDSANGSDPRRVDCTTVDVAVSPEKIDLLSDLADTFNDSDRASVDGKCVFIDVRSKSSGVAMSALATGWDEDVDGPRPVIWSPAASSWGTILNSRLTARGESAMAPENPSSFMLTPLVIAMPEPMAKAMGYPDKPIGWAQILELAKSPDGWAT